MLKRTPVIAVFIAALIAIVVVYFLELPERPFSAGQKVLLYIISYCVGLGISLLFDPKAKETKNKYLKINFYED
ncbi:MAG: hypothetical protein JW864_18780 [Spirochaetes bacterium]|nr:hypothetical protein [Spirochaetota bacterium]